jgi:hypothetical protein
VHSSFRSQNNRSFHGCYQNREERLLAVLKPRNLVTD